MELAQSRTKKGSTKKCGPHLQAVERGSGVFQENVANFLFHAGGKCNGQGTRTGEKDPPQKRKKKDVNGRNDPIVAHLKHTVEK